MRANHALALLGFGLAWGCGSSPPCGLQRCDIRETACQNLVAASAACLREAPLLQVPVTVILRDDYVSQRIAGAVTPQNDQSFQVWNVGLALLGLSPHDASQSDTTAISAGNVGAFYSPKDKSITIVDGGQAFDSRGAVSLLAHEYTHALQDATFGFDAFENTNALDFDRALAANAVTEGEATVVEDLVNVGLFGDDANAVPWNRVFDGWIASTRRDSAASSFPVTLAWTFFHYPFGTPFVHAAFVAEGWEGVDRLHVAPPSSAREVMAGFAATEPAGGPWAEDLGTDSVPILPARFQYFDFDRMGTWILEQFVDRLDPKPTAPIGNLRGDVLSLFQDQTTGGVLAIWRLRFPSSQAAAVLLNVLAVSTLAGGSDAAARGFQLNRDVVVIAAQNADILAAVPDQLVFARAPPPTSSPTMRTAGTITMVCPTRPRIDAEAAR